MQDYGKVDFSIGLEMNDLQRDWRRQKISRNTHYTKAQQNVI